MEKIDSLKSLETLPQPQYRGIVILRDGESTSRNVSYGTSFTGDRFPLDKLVNEGLKIRQEKLPNDREYPVGSVLLKTKSNNIYWIRQNEGGWEYANMKTGETGGITGLENTTVGEQVFFANGANTSPIIEIVAISPELVSDTYLRHASAREKPIDPQRNNDDNFYKMTTIYDDFKGMLKNFEDNQSGAKNSIESCLY